jgi:hypothetical protein
MPKLHTVQEGDCIDSIAADHGFFPATLWNHDANAELKAKRRDRHVLAVGDVVAIPDLREKKLPVATGRRHSFVRKGVPAKLSLRLLQEDRPRAGLRYVLVVEGTRLEGETDDGGWLEHWVSPLAKKATLTLADNEVYDVLIGYLEPIDTDAGVLARLENLGHLAHGAGPEAIPSGVESFERARGREPTGDLTAELRDLLVEANCS